MPPILIFKKLTLEREEGKEAGVGVDVRKTSIGFCVLGMCPDHELNPRPSGAQHEASTN